MPSRIPTHRPKGMAPARALRKAYERTETRVEDKAFYKSPRWRRLRAWFLAEHPLCQDCLKEGMLTTAEHVHHKVDRKARPDLALDQENLEALCLECHGAKRGTDGP